MRLKTHVQFRLLASLFFDEVRRFSVFPLKKTIYAIPLECSCLLKQI